MRVAVTLTNKTATITDASPEALKAMDAHLSFYPKGYRFAPAFKHGAWDGRIKFLKSRSLPAGLFRAERKAMNEVGLKFTVTHSRLKVKKSLLGVEGSARTQSDQYSYQTDCVDAMVNALTDGGGVVLMLTGGGKTAIAARFAARVQYTVLFIVDQVDLLYQSQKELADWLGEPVGVVGNSEFKPERVTVATIQTLSAHSKIRKIRDAGKPGSNGALWRKNAIHHVNEFRRWMATQQIMITDELHTQMARRNFKVTELANPIGRYALTATLKMNLKEIRLRVGALAGPIIYEFPMQAGVKAGVVSKGTVLQLLFDRRPEREGDSYQEEYPYQTYNHSVKRKALKAIAQYLIEDKQKYLMLLVERVAHLEKLSDYFTEINVGHGTAYGGVTKEKRLSNIEDFECGRIRLMIANKVFTKGVNIKRVDVEIDLAEYADTNAARQKYGRGVRLHKEKSHLLYIDFGTWSQPGDSLKENRGNGSRFARAAKARARAFKKDGTRVVKARVTNANEALQAVVKILNKVEKIDRSKAVKENQ